MNIQQTIIEGLKAQLYRHQYIVLPGFGGFVLKHRAAHFSAQGTQLLPPSKTVSFNAQLKQNDGILSAWLQQKISCSAEKASGHLNDFAGYIKGVLENRRRLSLPGIGFFHLDFENNTCFEPQADHNFLAESFGLSAVNLQENKTETKPLRKKPVFEDRLVVTTREPSAAGARMKRAALPLMLVAVISLLLVLLASVSTFKGELRAALSGGNHESSYTPVNYEPLELLKPKDKSGALVSDAAGIAKLSIGCSDIAVNVLRNDVVTGKRYEIVLGCFSVPGNARKMLRQLKRKNIEAGISAKKHKGMTVVIYDAYSDKNSALLQLPSVKQVIPNAWIKEP